MFKLQAAEIILLLAQTQENMYICSERDKENKTSP